MKQHIGKQPGFNGPTSEKSAQMWGAPAFHGEPGTMSEGLSAVPHARGRKVAGLELVLDVVKAGAQLALNGTHELINNYLAVGASHVPRFAQDAPTQDSRNGGVRNTGDDVI